MLVLINSSTEFKFPPGTQCLAGPTSGEKQLPSMRDSSYRIYVCASASHYDWAKAKFEKGNGREREWSRIGGVEEGSQKRDGPGKGGRTDQWANRLLDSRGLTLAGMLPIGCGTSLLASETELSERRICTDRCESRPQIPGLGLLSSPELSQRNWESFVRTRVPFLFLKIGHEDVPKLNFHDLIPKFPATGR
ncbi:hypothetical protein ACTXT7_003881 [Hymenolepis weldensis]